MAERPSDDARQSAFCVPWTAENFHLRDGGSAKARYQPDSDLHACAPKVAAIGNLRHASTDQRGSSRAALSQPDDRTDRHPETIQ